MSVRFRLGSAMDFDHSYSSPIPGKSDSSWPTVYQLAGIGSVIAAWNWLDLAIESLLATLTKSDEMLVQALTEDLSQDNRLKALRRLAITWERIGRLNDEHKALFAEIRRIVKDVAQAKVLRNKIAHGLWIRNDDEAMYRWKHHVAPIASNESFGEHVTVSELLDFSKQVGGLAGRAAVVEIASRDLPPFPGPLSSSRGMPPVPGLASLLAPHRLRGEP